jgi:nitrite reductase (cytochrome c-552)
MTDMLDASTRREGGRHRGRIAPALELQRKAQWRLDFVAAENSMGFHAPAEAARILAESIDDSRQAQLIAAGLTRR